MKKICLLLLIISMSLMAFNLSVSAYEANTEINVSIPTFDVTVNGVEYNSDYSEYPFLVYNDITYMPMTYDFATFMGINITFNMGVNEVYHKGEMILHIGNAERTAIELGQYLKNIKNKASDMAVIPDYHTYVSFEENEYDNQSLYPVINYKGITYLPLTWDVMHTLLDWEYSFDQDRGLVINSTKAVRPNGMNRKLFNRMGTSTNEYVLGENCYLSYDIDVYYSGNILWVSGDETKEYNLQEQLKGKINYFNRMYKNGSLVKAEIPPELNGNILTIMCAKKDFGFANVMLTIDLNEGKVIDEKPL